MLGPRKALGHNRNVCDLRRPRGQHGTVGGIENGIHRNHNKGSTSWVQHVPLDWKYVKLEKAQTG